MSAGPLSVSSDVSTNIDADKMYSGVSLTIGNTLIPEERLSPTPSMLDGLDLSAVTDLRILGCELIQSAGILLRMPQVAMATGQVLFHRFFYSKSFVKHSFEIVAMACTYLASKIEEAPRRIRDVLNVFHHLRQIRAKKTPTSLILDQNYINTKNLVLKAEMLVLKELGFCVQVKHPHKIIVMYLQVLECEKNKTLVQTAWNYMNDSLRTNVFVRFPPETIACACIDLAARVLQIPLPTEPHWYLLFDATAEKIKEISITTLRLYTREKPNWEQLEKEVEKRKAFLAEAKLKAKALNPDGTPALTSVGKSTKEECDGQNQVSKSPHSGVRREAKNGRNSRSGSKSQSRTRSRSRSRSPQRHYRRSRSGTYSSRSHSRSHSRSPSPPRHPPSSLLPHLKTKSTHHNSDSKSSGRHSNSSSGHKRKRSRSRTPIKLEREKDRERERDRERFELSKNHERGSSHRERRERERSGSYDRERERSHRERSHRERQDGERERSHRERSHRERSHRERSHRERSHRQRSHKSKHRSSRH